MIRGLVQLSFALTMVGLLAISAFAGIAYPQERTMTEVSVMDTKVDPVLPMEMYLDVPYHSQDMASWTGQAALESVFDYYGEDIPQNEIDNVIAPILGDPVAEDLVRGGHFSNSSNAKNSPTMSGYGDRGLGYAAFTHNWGNLMPNPSPDYKDRKYDLKRMISNNTPVILWTMVNTSAYSGQVWRVLTGYNDITKQFVLHDLTTNNPPGYSGEGILIDQDLFVNKIWNTSGGDRIGVVVQPWSVDLIMPEQAMAGSPFTVTAMITYPVQEPMRGTAYPASNSKSTITVPEGYTLKNTTPRTQSINIENGGETATVAWEVLAPEKGDGRIDIIMVDASGYVSGRQGILRYTDLIGAGGEMNISVQGSINHPPVITDAAADPSSIPRDGTTETLLSAKVIDQDSNLKEVYIDLSKIGKADHAPMYDDGTNGDYIAGDDTYSVMTTASTSSVDGTKELTITAKDMVEVYTTSVVVLEITDPDTPPTQQNRPEMKEFTATPSSAPNDAQTLVRFSVHASDKDGDLSQVKVDLSSIGGDANQQMYDDGTYGDLAPQDNYYSYETFILQAVSPGEKAITSTALDKKDNKAQMNITFEVTENNLNPILSDPMSSPASVPNDGTTPVLLKVKGTDPNDNLKSVIISLLPIGGAPSQKMFDDGTHGDNKQGDSWFCFETSVPETISVGQKDLKITAEDGSGLQDVEHIFVTITDSNIAPELVDPEASLSKVPNDNKTRVKITVKASDADGNLDSVTIDLSPLGGPSNRKMYDDGRNGEDETNGDGIYSVSTVVSKKTPAGTRNLTITAKDAKGATSTVKVSVKVTQRTEARSSSTPGFEAAAMVMALIAVAILACIGQSRRRR